MEGRNYDLFTTDLHLEHREVIHIQNRPFEGIRDYLREHNIEGIVFWENGEPRCKIKRSDFGFPWPENRMNIIASVV